MEKTGVYLDVGTFLFFVFILILNATQSSLDQDKILFTISKAVFLNLLILLKEFSNTYSHISSGIQIHQCISIKSPWFSR